MPQSGRVPGQFLIFEFSTGCDGTNINIDVCKTSLNALHRESAVRFNVNYSVYIYGSGINSLVIVVYPGSATVTDQFFESFTDLLERIVSYKYVIIAGDTNSHLDNLTDHHTNKFNRILTVFGLTQHVQSSTHRCDHLNSMYSSLVPI